MSSMYFIIFGILQDFTPKMLEIAFEGLDGLGVRFAPPPPPPKKNEGLATPLLMTITVKNISG